MSGNFRARRPASPPPGVPLSSQPQPPSFSSQRFPHPRQDHLDADSKREAASKGLYVPGRSSKANYPSGGINLTSGEIPLLLVIVLVAAGVRLYRLSKPNSVVFDEVHFGKFASRYIKTRYFVDVHPPLAKLLITLAGFLFGYDGNFDFKDIGKVYENVPYVAMRLVPALLGVFTVPLAYLTLRALDCRATTALLASLFITFENGLVTQSRHILLDSPLLFFTSLSLFSFVGFTNEDRVRPFTESWWTWLVLSGLSLGAVVSCKWVGLFTIATVGSMTVFQLWTLLGDLRVPPRLFIKHFAARALCLIIIPIFFYMTMFAIHFALLQSSGDGDGFMSSEFQHTLSGRGMQDTFADVAVGSQITIRHYNTQGGYLHSHSHNYPTGSKQQQITLYPHRDTNNDWILLNATADNTVAHDWANEPLVLITPGMRVKLRHTMTEKHLHSHDHRPPVSEVDFQNEVSGYGMPGFAGDANDDWIVEIDKDYTDSGDRKAKERLRTLKTKFKLRHALTGCYLFSHKVKLPEWAYEQQEVTCNKNAVRQNSLWFIETSWHDGMDKGGVEKVNYKRPSFFSKFWELQQVMWTTNAGLTERHTFDSRPEQWPGLRRGINFWVKDHRQIYLVGNPLVWWMSSLAVFAWIGTCGILVLRQKRGCRDFNNSTLLKYTTLSTPLFLGWFLHYTPFFLMSRQLFLHHYFPALYFAILLCCAWFDWGTRGLKQRVRLGIAALLIISVILTFRVRSPLAYGTPWTKKECESAKWKRTWDFSCNDFLDSYSAYASLHTGPGTPTKSTMVPVATVGGEPGGRGPAVVNNQDLNGEQKEGEENTSTYVNKVEPGRDIFAGDVRGGEGGTTKVPAQNQEQDKGLAEDEERIVSQVHGGGISAPPSEDDKPVVEEKNEDQKDEEKATQETLDNEGMDPIPPKDSKKEEKPGKPEGPLVEEDAAAEKVAQDLYPEEAD
ncbi:PMT-domain-containing protein [Dendrothele bispora CBS 962.96]|uniref:Dolichyl-phosphate-mannose--protein mannosyltransferase n=1 Tax=Dendrothele bispora (strain CBS 962.96) TaxID=1314807 RepID=A0A4V4HB58_DENBC|nr:PMT-domain-containing protein [Dendrothele bispora CBS 962.96]